MQTIFRNPHERILTVPFETGTSPHKQAQQQHEEETILAPQTVIRINSLGHIENAADKRQALWDDFERKLGLDDELNPMDEPISGIRVLKNRGIVFREMDAWS